MSLPQAQPSQLVVQSHVSPFLQSQAQIVNIPAPQSTQSLQPTYFVSNYPTIVNPPTQTKSLPHMGPRTHYPSPHFQSQKPQIPFFWVSEQHVNNVNTPLPQQKSNISHMLTGQNAQKAMNNNTNPYPNK